LTPDEAAGLRALDDGECNGEVLREYLAAEIDSETWKAWLRAYRQFEA
jgi:hypothetical protein